MSGVSVHGSGAPSKDRRCGSYDTSYSYDLP
jgi:hypothetical protein